MDEKVVDIPRADEMHRLMTEFRQLYKEKLQRLEDNSVGESEETTRVY